MPVASPSDRAQSAPESGAAGGSYPTRSPKVKTMTCPNDPVDDTGWSLADRSRPEGVESVDEASGQPDRVMPGDMVRSVLRPGVVQDDTLPEAPT